MGLTREELENLALIPNTSPTPGPITTLLAAAPKLALACLRAQKYIAYLESLVGELGHPYDDEERATPDLLAALEAAGVEVPE